MGNHVRIEKLPRDRLEPETLPAFINSFFHINVARDDAVAYTQAMIRVLRHLVAQQPVIRVRPGPTLQFRMSEDPEWVCLEILELGEDDQPTVIETTGWIRRQYPSAWAIELERILMRVVRRLIDPRRIRQRIERGMRGDA